MQDSQPVVTAPPPAAAKASHPRRPWREQLEGVGVAVLMAVLLKPMLLEAYQIPTPSMQPTLMGSPEAKVFDRILVDKMRYEIVEPKRWDIVVFRYPIRRNQNYVKRIVGIPGDALRIAAGNLWQVAADGQIAQVVRKPDHIQKGLWKELFPARQQLDVGTKTLDEFFAGQIGSWKQDGDTLVVTPSSKGKTRLQYTDLGHGGLCDQVWDGYPTEVARAIRSDGRGSPSAGVQDLRLTAVLTPTAAPSLVRMEIVLTPPGKKPHALRFEVADGKARLLAAIGTEVKAVTEPMDCALVAGQAVEFAFAQIDDRLVAWRDGTEIATLEVGAARCTTELEPKSVGLALEVEGSGELRVGGLKVERDLHYLQEGLADALEELVPEGQERSILNHVIRVPTGHYFMMGDNTQASADSRQWKVVKIGVTEDGQAVDPATNGQARPMVGNRRPWDLNGKPDNDENPVIVRDPSPALTQTVPVRIAFTDDNGQVLPLRSKISKEYSPLDLKLVEPNGRTWKPEEKHVWFVPREHILGRPLVGFWPLNRIGFIR